MGFVTFLAYCGDKTCCHNDNGKCKHFKMALNDQGMCMGYSPLFLPPATPSAETENKIDKIIGF